MEAKKLTIRSRLVLVLGGLLTAASIAQAVDVARVNKKVITDKDVQGALSNLNEGQRRKVLSDVNSKKEIVSSLVEQELLLQEGEKQKVDQEADFKEAMAQFRRQYISQRVLEKYIAPRVTDASARKYYGLNKRKYSNDKVEVLHILLADEKSANDVLRLAKAPNADFQSLAEKYSRDPSAKNNRGYLGPIGWDAPFVTEFKEAAFDAAKGEVVGPVKSLYGYHVIKVQDKRTGPTKGYDEVEMMVRDDLKRELAESYLTQLRKQAQVVVDDKSIQKL